MKTCIVNKINLTFATVMERFLNGIKRFDLYAVAVLLLLLLPFLYISQYAHPIADDFTYAVKGRTYGVLDNLAGEYLNWNGRYFSNLLVILNPLNSFGISGYQIIPVMMIVFLFLSFLWFIRVSLRELFSRNEKIAISLLMTLIYLNGMPDLAEGIYWYTGAVTYMTGNIGVLLFVGLLIKLIRLNYFLKNRVVHIAALILLQFLITGLNEIHMISLWILLGLFMYIHLIDKKRHNRTFLLLLILSVGFSMLVILSPGNEVRAGHFTGNHRLFYSFYMSLAQTGRFFIEWCFSLPLIFASILFYYLNRSLISKSAIFTASCHLKPWQSSLILFLVIFTGAFPAYWGTGILGQHRTMNVSYLLFLVIWFININVWINWFKTKQWQVIRIVQQFLSPVVKMSCSVSFIAALGLFLSLALTGNSYSVSSDLLSGRAKDFDRQMLGRYEALKSVQDTIYMAPVADPPKSIFVMDISETPSDWVNQGYLLYFDCKDKTIRLGE